MKEILSKINSLIDNYKKTFELIKKRIPITTSPEESSPHKYFITAEGLEEIIKIEIQLYKKFSNIIEIATENLKTSKNYLEKGNQKILSDGIHEFKYCYEISHILREKAISNLIQIKSADFKIRLNGFSEREQQEIVFSEKTLDTYNKKEKSLIKEYDISIAQASRLFGMMNK